MVSGLRAGVILRQGHDRSSRAASGLSSYVRQSSLPISSSGAHPPCGRRNVGPWFAIEEGSMQPGLNRNQTWLALAALIVIPGSGPALATGTPDGVWSTLSHLGRTWHAAVYDPAGDRMVIVEGDQFPCNFLGVAWALSLSGDPTWSPMFPTGTGPSARGNLSAVYDSARGRVVVFGGRGDGGLLNDVYALSLGPSPSWTRLNTAGTPPSVRFSSAAI